MFFDYTKSDEVLYVCSGFLECKIEYNWLYFLGKLV